MKREVVPESKAFGIGTISDEVSNSQAPFMSGVNTRIEWDYGGERRKLQGLINIDHSPSMCQLLISAILGERISILYFLRMEMSVCNWTRSRPSR